MSVQPLPTLLVQLELIWALAATWDLRVPSQCEAMLGSRARQTWERGSPKHWGTAVGPEQPWKCSQGLPSKGEQGRAGQAHDTNARGVPKPRCDRSTWEIETEHLAFLKKILSEISANISKGLQVRGNKNMRVNTGTTQKLLEGSWVWYPD